MLQERPIYDADAIVEDEARQYATDMVYLADLMLKSHDLCIAIANLAMKDGYTVGGRFENIVDAIKEHAREPVLAAYRFRIGMENDEGAGGVA